MACTPQDMRLFHTVRPLRARPGESVTLTAALRAGAVPTEGVTLRLPALDRFDLTAVLRNGRPETGLSGGTLALGGLGPGETVVVTVRAVLRQGPPGPLESVAALTWDRREGLSAWAVLEALLEGETPARTEATPTAPGRRAARTGTAQVSWSR